jgi:hypothetical protein
MAVLSRFIQLSIALLAVNASPLERRGTIGSDDIVGFAETVPSGTVGMVYEAYQPYLYVVNGCVPVGSNVNSPIGTSAHGLLQHFATPSFLAS